MRFARLVITLIGISAVSAQAKSAGSYTNAQAAHGAAVYTQHCAVCHGGSLQGEAELPSRDNFWHAMVRERQHSSMTFSAVRCLRTLLGA